MKKKGETKLPEFFREYFWDVSFEDIDPEKSKFMIIKRVIDRGNTSAVGFVINRYGLDEVKNVVLTTRDLDRATGNFWAEILNLDKSKVPCLQKPYSPIHWGLFS